MIVSISDVANCIDWSHSVRDGLDWDGVGKLEVVPNTSNDGMGSFGPIVTFIAFVAIRSVFLLSNVLRNVHIMLKILRRG